MRMDIAEPVNRLIEQFKKLPGIGTKSAQRLAFFVLKMDTADANELAETILEVKRIDSPMLRSATISLTSIPAISARAIAIRQGAMRRRGIEQHPARRKNA